MKAVVKRRRRKGMKFVDVSTPKIGPRDVLVKVKVTSICGTDVHIYDWTRWAQHRFTPPRIIGHEFVDYCSDPTTTGWPPVKRWERT